jgi:hypothetical protein
VKWAALIAWVLTAGGGFVLLAIWLTRGGMRQAREPGTRIRPALILSHFLLAAAGLVVWLVYLANESSALPWIALVMLGIVALLGWTMFAIWYQLRQGRVAEAVDPGTPAEQHFPVPVVALHGLGAVTTVALVFLTAIGVGD